MNEVNECVDHLMDLWDSEELVFVAHRVSLLYQDGDYYFVSNVMNEFKRRVDKGIISYNKEY